ncbi:methylglutaconyl-CoA hydratase [Stella humosa]|uniref:Methylglutaconyl-CoA hydratase n=1 Tax=Stella humosa TaxID=94 RepID=A0A3N1KTK4_9PROT|nr:enoyl-CoA hydratase/isomerase family protein [Stella humosa]ROP83921.1 methylglutaconyl-CoA hydratase [Stella humosa]BBK32817.1 enoyl-CoA hydratase [Stella humosa]
MAGTVLVSVSGHVARVTLNRPEVHNAFDDRLIAELTGIFERLAADPAVRAVLLCANGRSFSAGADLNWMKRTAGYSEAQNLGDARALARMLRTLDGLPQPTVALVQGPAYGGGVGLVACCDIAVAVPEAAFSLSEVRLGLLPAAISPYVVAAIGARQARRYFLTAERFDAGEARRIGLVHEIAAREELEATGRRLLESLAQGGTLAQAASKRLIARVAGAPVDDALVEDTAGRIAGLRAGEEGREGVAAFLEKRRPSWRPA